jgi:YidC/Oxa1 family membrane protein insertase
MFHTLFYKPMYNALIYILSLLPSGNIAIAVIILTVIVKIILLPLSKKMFLSQVAQKKIQPLLKKIQEEYKGNKQMLGIKMMELYKEHKLNPFSSILLLFIQIPIVFALYFVFSRGGLPIINIADLYSFVPHIVDIDHYLWGVDFIKASTTIGFVAALFQYIQIRLSLLHMADSKTKEVGQVLKPEERIQQQMSFMMKYFIPILIFIASMQVSAAVALYWIVSSVFMIAQELYFRRKYKDQLTKA